MRRLFVLALLAAVGLSGCFWGERGYRRDDRYRQGGHGEHDERGRDHGRDYDHHDGR
jgi:hypothetical protein